MGAGERFAVVRTGLRWLAPVLSVGLLGLVIARASCSERRDGPAAVVPDADTRAAPAVNTRVNAAPKPGKSDFLGGTKSFVIETAPALEQDASQLAPAAAPPPSNSDFLGGSKTGMFELHRAIEAEQAQQPSRPESGTGARQAQP
jgi:hypothetical protein